MEKITKNDYRVWKNMAITKKLFESLQEIRDETQKCMSNESVIMSENCQKTLVRSLGILEGLDIILNMDFEDMVDEENIVMEESESNEEFY